MSVDRRNVLRVGTVLAAAMSTGACGHPAAPIAAVTMPEPARSRAHLPAEVEHGPRDRPNIALTFHGQGDPDQVSRLLAVLAKGGARVTVLAVGAWLDEYAEIVPRILAGGHELGNHTQNHLAIADLPAAQAYAEISGCANRLRKLTGSIGAWFRPSQTRTATKLIRAQAARAGYPTCLSYDVDSLDYTDPAPADVVGTVLRHVRPGSIVSLHFGHETTIAAMPPILDGLRSRGLRPVTATELLAR